MSEALTFPSSLPDDAWQRLPARLAVPTLISLLCSPATLYLDRNVASLIVFPIIALGCLSLLWTIELDYLTGWSSLFAVYVFCNGLLSFALFNHQVTEVVGALTPVLECWACFQIGKKCNYSTEKAFSLWQLALWFVLMRASLQLCLFFSNHADLLHYPIYKGAGQNGQYFEPLFNVAGWRVQRLIDPVCCAFVIPGLILFPKLRRLAKLTLLSTLGVSLLSFMRAAWIGSVGALSYFAAKSGTLKRLIFWGILTLAVFGAASAYFGIGLNLYDRVFTYTETQIFNPAYSLQQLRFLEYRTAWDALSKDFLFGSGLGGRLGTWVTDALGKSEWVLIHNYWLDLFAEIGLVGLFLFFGVLDGIRCWLRSSYQTGNTKLILAAMTLFIWYGVFVAFQPIYATYHIPALGALFLGMANSRSTTVLTAPNQSPSGIRGEL